MSGKSYQTALFISFAILMQVNVYAQKIKIPKSYSNIKSKQGKLFIQDKKIIYPEEISTPVYTYTKLAEAKITGNKDGIFIDFTDKNLNGRIDYGLIKTENIKYPLPVYFKRNTKLKEGKAYIHLKNLKGVYDYTAWEKQKKLLLGYRFINDKGQIIYDGRIAVKIDEQNIFVEDVYLIEGPFVNKLTSDGATITFKTNKPVVAQIKIGGQVYSDIVPVKRHQININGLKPQTLYNYTLTYDDWKVDYAFTTKPKKGCRSKFVFAYASDSRAGKGSGERNIFGVNAYIIKKMMMFSAYKKTAFFQFTGDMISGYSGSNDEMNLEYLNWKRAVENYWHYAPVYIGMGNHESTERIFKRTGYDGHSYYSGHLFVDKFPFDKYSAEATFADNFCLPESDLVSEDNNVYDPSGKTTDFPSYKENVYDYTYGNLAMIVLNSNYWYASSTKDIPLTSGNVHGYIMDNQLAWLKKTIEKYESDKDIDHIIVSIHTPPFPNAGHKGDDMWYDGNNKVRPYIAGKPVDKGIIERRDEFLDILVNQSKKFVVLLCGDEHNYSRLVVDNNTPVYPDNWTGKKLNFKRKFIQITNGSAGAPYYSLQKLPWTKFVKKFSTLHALMLFTVEGQHINMEVINPDTFEIIEKVKLK
jgi:hypothetical protein